MNQQLYYFELNGQQSGPIELQQLAGMIQNGAVSLDTRVWTEGMPNWAPFASLFPNMIRATPPLPPFPVQHPQPVPQQTEFARLHGSFRSESQGSSMINIDYATLKKWKTINVSIFIIYIILFVILKSAIDFQGPIFGFLGLIFWILFVIFTINIAKAMKKDNPILWGLLTLIPIIGGIIILIIDYQANSMLKKYK